MEQKGQRLIGWFSDNQIQANSGKVQALLVGNNTKNEGLCYKFEYFEIKCDVNVKRLGVTIDFSFDEHISILCTKAPADNWMFLNVLTNWQAFV